MAPIEVPYTIESVVVAVPAKEWKVTRDANGIITANLMDRQHGLLVSSTQLNFERGDQVNIRYHLDELHPTYVAEGKKVITVESIELEQRLIRAASQLRVEERNREALATGQKPELITQLEAEVDLARQTLDLQQKNFNRIKGLYENEAVSQAEFEQAETALNEARVNVKIAAEALQVARTGEKPESIAAANARIKALKAELEILRRKKEGYELASPISGKASYETGPGSEAFVIRDTSALTLQIPVKMRDRNLLVIGQPVRLKIRETGRLIPARLESIGPEPQLLGGELTVIVNAVPENAGTIANWSVPMRCELDLGKVTIREFLRRAVRWQ